MQWDVSVGVEFADRCSQPPGVADLGDRVAGQAEELAFAEPGQGKDFDGDTVEQVGNRRAARAAGGGVGVTEEPR